VNCTLWTRHKKKDPMGQLDRHLISVVHPNCWTKAKWEQRTEF
jgi:hypothetical protein